MRLTNVATDATSAAVHVPSSASDHLTIARQKAIVVIENFAGYSLDTFVRTLLELFSVLRRDSAPAEQF